MVEGLAALERRTFSSLSFRNYRLYLIGQGISLCGSWMQTMAGSWLVLQLTGSGTALGVVNGLASLPMLICSPWFGVIIDRLPKRHILYMTQTASAVLALSLGLLVKTGSVQLWMVYVLTLALGVVNALDYPTRQAFMAELVGQDELANAIPLYAGESNLARVIGPILAGGVITFYGLATCFLINALSFAALVIVLWAMRTAELHPLPLVRVRPGQLVQGLRYAWINPTIRVILLMTFFIGAISMEFQVLMPLFAHHVFKGDVSLYTIFTAWMGLGAVLGSLYTAEVGRTTPRIIAGMSLLLASSLLVGALAPTLSIAKAAMVVMGFSATAFVSSANITVQLSCAPKMRGRVMALWTVAFAGSTVVGGPVIGWIGQHAGSRWGLAVGAIAAILTAAYGYLSLRRHASWTQFGPAKS